MEKQNLLARLPKVDQILGQKELSPVLQDLPRPLVVEAVRRVLDDLRQRMLAKEAPNERELSLEEVAARSKAEAYRLAQPSLRRVVNATGVVVHTNLGRSLLSKAAIERLTALNSTYTNLEYDLDAGKRGSRYVHVAGILKELTGAEAALVVNNNAAAVYLCLQTLATGKEVIVSRGQLVEIGGSFRIPDVMTRSGAILKEVGATNRTHLKDYEQAIGSKTAMLLKVHTSNFAVVGFHHEVPLTEMRELADRYHLPLMDDLGSGSLVDFTSYGLPYEPTVRKALADGADLVTFSGDKLLGGPQAGVILGRRDLVESLAKNPLNRALRIDKLTLAALEATLEIYRDPQQAMRLVPTLAMISIPLSRLSRLAQRLARRLRSLNLPRLSVRTAEGTSRVGGGALPLGAPKTRLLEVAVEGMSPTRLEASLRANEVPVICRLEDGRLLMDVRTMLAGDGEVVIRALARLAGGETET